MIMVGGVAYVWTHPESIGMDPETNAWELSQALLRYVLVFTFPVSSFWDAQKLRLSLRKVLDSSLPSSKFPPSLPPSPLLRGLRLGKIVVLIVADYKLSSYTWWDPHPRRNSSNSNSSSCSSSKNNTHSPSPSLPPPLSEACV